MNIEEIDEYVDGAFEKARRSSNPEDQKLFLSVANEAAKLRKQVNKEEEPIATDGTWFTREHTTKFTWWQILAGVATPIATLGAAIFAFAGIKKQSEAMVECKRIETESKERMMKEIVRTSEYDTPDTLSLKVLNDLNK